MSTSHFDQRDRVRPNWPVFATVAAAGVALGAAPYLLYMRAGYLALALFVYAAFVLARKGRSYECQATERPEPLEWLLAGWSAVGVGAVASVIGLLWYWGVYGLAWLAGAAIGALGLRFTIDPAELGLYFSGAFFAIFAATLPFVLADELLPKLYPRIAGTRSAYFALANQRWLVGAVAVAMVAAAAGAALWGVDLHGFWFTFIATVVFLFTGTWLVSVGDKAPTSPEAAEAIDVVKKLFTAAGYALTEKPSTGDPESDPLIAVVDILARAPSRAYAVKVKMLAGAAARLEWSSAVELRAAAKIIQRVLRAADAPESIVEPYLLVIGGTIGEELPALAAEEQILLVHFADAGALRAAWLADAPPAEQRARALDALRVVPAAASPPGARAT